MKPFYYIYNATIGEFTGEKFDTRERATKWSLEFAEENPGQSFEILKCVGHSSTSKASTFWMDGEGPPHPLGANAAGLVRNDGEETPEKPRYRMLDRGEVTQKGDEFLAPFGNWKKVGVRYSITPNHYPHRRPL